MNEKRYCVWFRYGCGEPSYKRFSTLSEFHQMHIDDGYPALERLDEFPGFTVFPDESYFWLFDNGVES